MEIVNKICLEMFSQRGYDILEEEEDQILANKKDGTQVIAFISSSPKFNVEKIQEYITIIKKMDINHCIIVYKDNATPVAKKVVDELTDIVIELFHEDEMQYNITKHVLVPLHEIEHKCNTKGCEMFKKKYGNKFPIILKSDPVARFYGYEKGDIIKITRKNGYITYRLVK